MQVKIRYKTWYWGKWVYNGDYGYSLDLDGFELYIEEDHGIHNEK